MGGRNSPARPRPPRRPRREAARSSRANGSQRTAPARIAKCPRPSRRRGTSRLTAASSSRRSAGGTPREGLRPAARGRAARRPRSAGSERGPASAGREAALAGDRGARLRPRRGSGEAQALERRREVARLHSGPLGDVGTRGGPEGGEVAPDEQVLRGVFVDLFRADPGLRRLEHVRAPLLPGSRRRHTDELEPGPDHAPAPADDLDELLLPPRAVGQPTSQLSRLPLQLPLARPRLVHAQPPLALRPSDRDRKRPEVAP